MNQNNNYYNDGKYINVEDNLHDSSLVKVNKSPYYFNNPKYKNFLENKHLNLKLKKHVKNNDIKYLSDSNNISDGDLEIL